MHLSPELNLGGLKQFRRTLPLNCESVVWCLTPIVHP